MPKALAEGIVAGGGAALLHAQGSLDDVSGDADLTGGAGDDLTSFGIPFALIPLIWFTRDRRIMGLLVNRRLTSWAAYAGRRGDHRAQRLPAGLRQDAYPGTRRTDLAVHDTGRSISVIWPERDGDCHAR